MKVELQLKMVGAEKTPMGVWRCCSVVSGLNTICTVVFTI